MKVITTEEFLKDIIKGDTVYRCSGYPIPNSHETVDYRLDIGRWCYSYACPICGFGIGGSLPEELANKLQKLRSSV